MSQDDEKAELKKSTGRMLKESLLLQHPEAMLMQDNIRFNSDHDGVA
jgi:hypothetical protein